MSASDGLTISIRTALTFLRVAMAQTMHQNLAPALVKVSFQWRCWNSHHSPCGLKVALCPHRQTGFTARWKQAASKMQVGWCVPAVVQRTVHSASFS